MTQHLQFRKIVAATELGDTGSAVVRYAQELAHRHNATLIILHVIDPVLYAFPDGLPPALAAVDSVRAEVAKLEEEARSQGIQVHSRVESGVICERILQCITDQHADLLILGTRTHGAAGHLAIGTVVRQLIGRCPCPILTVPPEAAPERFAQLGWRNVLAATDLTPCGLHAIKGAHQLTTGLFTVLHVLGEGEEATANARLAELRLETPFNESHTVPVDHIAASGQAVEYVSGLARDLHVDLLVLGAPTQQLASKELPSSTILQIVAQVNCPVLCIPVHAEGRVENGRLQAVTA